MIRRFSPFLPLAAFVVLASTSLPHLSPAFDELFHITGGYSYWTRDDFRIHPSNGNLIQRWIALPLLTGEFEFPPTDLEGWRRPKFNGFEVSREFFYGSAHDRRQLLLRPRWMVLLLSLVLGYAVYQQSRRYFGRPGGILSLSLYSFCPTVLAHGALATSDLAAALFFFLAVTSVWSLLHRLTIGELVRSLFASTGLFLVKFSAPLLLPMTAAMIAARLLNPKPYPIHVFGWQRRLCGRAKLLSLFVAMILVHGLAVWTGVWTAFNWRFQAASQADRSLEFSNPWNEVMDLKGKMAPWLIRFGLEHQVLPEAYLFGLAHTLKHSESRDAYLRGECSETGWWYFFPYSFLIKTPLSVHAFIGLAILSVAWRTTGRGAFRRKRPVVLLYQTTPFWCLLGVYWYSAIRSNLNLGIRHLLPAFPPLFVLLGCLGPLAAARRSFRFLVVVLIAFQVVDVARVHPDFVSYFNQLIGGPANGYKHLADSSLDWGQNLPTIGDWLDERGLNDSQRLVFLSYAGIGEPSLEGVHIQLLGDYLTSLVTEEQSPPRSEVTICIGANAWSGCNQLVPRWKSRNEAELRSLLDRIRSRREQGLRADEESIITATILLRMRLTAFLRARQPDDRIAYSHLVYRLTAAEFLAALHGPPPFE